MSCATSNCSKTNESRHALGCSAASPVINSGLSSPAFERGNKGKSRVWGFFFPYSLSHYAAERDWARARMVSKQNRTAEHPQTLPESIGTAGTLWLWETAHPSSGAYLEVERLILNLRKKISVLVGLFLFYFQRTKSGTLCQTGQVPGQGQKRRRKPLSRRWVELSCIPEPICAHRQQTHNKQSYSVSNTSLNTAN